MNYSVRAFAELTGVTLKALRHYERRGLLTPTRTRAGYRRYTLRDLAQVELIVALKSLGLSLTHTVLRRTLLAEGADLTVGMLGEYWLAIPFVLLTGLAMVCYDLWGALAVSEVNRAELEG